MQIPAWYANARDDHARLIVAGEETREAAIVSMRTLVRDTHREYGNQIIDGYNSTQLGDAIVEATPKPIPIPAEAIVAIAERGGSLTVQEATALAGDSTRHADAVVKSMIEQELVTRSGPRISLTDKGKLAAQEAHVWRLQSSMFPFMPRELKATPSRKRAVPFMSTHELDTARAVLYAKTGNSIDGAEKERANFDKFYNTVRPLMNDGDIVADALEKLAKKRV